MPRIAINGIGIDYELIGPENGPAVVITPGGRFARDAAGLQEFAQELAHGGKRVLLWSRPNCGASDVCFEGDNESLLQARTLLDLADALNLGKIIIAGGSGGARVSLMAAAMAPERVSHLIVWWVSGGAIGLAQLAWYYCCEPGHYANAGGIEAALKASSLQENLAKNPNAREQILRYSPKEFIDTMQRWAAAYFPYPDSPVPGMTVEDFAKLKMPVLVYRSGESDLSHTRRTSEWVHELIPGSHLAEPPWPDTEWNDRSGAVQAGKAAGLFVNWKALAPAILSFTFPEG